MLVETAVWQMPFPPGRQLDYIPSLSYAVCSEGGGNACIRILRVGEKAQYLIFINHKFFQNRSKGSISFLGL